MTIIGPLIQLTTITLTQMRILHMTAHTPMLQLMLIRGHITPMPQPRFLTQRPFIQVEQEVQAVPEEQVERAVQAEQVEQAVQAERVVQAVQVVPEEQVAPAVREQLAKEAEQVAEVLFS